MTNRPSPASSRQRSGSQPSIDSAAPAIRRIGGALRSPKVSTHRSTPSTRAISTAMVATLAGELWLAIGGVCVGTDGLGHLLQHPSRQQDAPRHPWHEPSTPPPPTHPVSDSGVWAARVAGDLFDELRARVVGGRPCDLPGCAARANP